MAIKGTIEIDASRESDRFPVREDVFAAYYRAVTGEDVPSYMTAIEKRAFLVACVQMEEN